VGEAPAWGSDCDRAALVVDLVAAQHPARALFVAYGVADPARRAALVAALRPQVDAEQQALDLAAVNAWGAACFLRPNPPASGDLPRMPHPPAAPALDLGQLLAEALRTLGQLLDPATGELRRVRVDAALLRAWVAQQAPDLDTTAIEQLLPGVRALVAAERQQARAAGEWAAERARVRALPDTPLLLLCKRRAARHAGAMKRSDPSAGYAAALALVADDERRRRGLDLAALDAEAQGQRPRKASRQDFTTRRALQAGQAERRAGMLGLFDARAHDPITSAPATPAHRTPPPDDGAPPPASVERPAPARVVAARPRVALARRPDEGPTPARADGMSSAECDVWLFARGWYRDAGGEWVDPARQEASRAA